jgi:hypothetical protein
LGGDVWVDKGFKHFGGWSADQHTSFHHRHLRELDVVHFVSCGEDSTKRV